MSRTDSRNKPRQNRSRQLVEALLTATAQLLAEEGYDKASTNRIAKRAGVSVGSLYQYFPNKEALVSELVRRHADRQFAVLSSRMPELAGAELRPAVRGLIVAMLEAVSVDPALSKVLLEQVPRSGHFREVRGWMTRMSGPVALALATRRGQLRIDDPDTLATIIVAAIQGVLQHAVLEKPGLLHSPQLPDELTELALGYLLADSVQDSGETTV